MPKKRSESGRKAGLEVKVVGGRLSITVGVECLAWGYENSKDGQPWNDAANKYEQAHVTDPDQFAGEVLLAMEREKEDGSTLVSDMLDAACEMAVGDGAEGVEYPVIPPATREEG